MKQNKDRDNKPGIVRAAVITVGTLLILSTAFVFLAFRTDYIFNINTDSTVTSAYFERTTVTTIIEEINELESGSGDLVPTVDVTQQEGEWWYPPAAGTSIDVSFGVDAQNETRVVTDYDTWTIEYSIQGCFDAFGEGALCSKRLRTAYELFGVNHNESGDLLKLSVDGTPCFAGAMIGDPFNVGDVVEVELTNGASFNFMLLDAKSNQHTYEELGHGSQVQNKWGHGYPVGSDSVQMSICEFICNQTRGGASNAKDLPSGGFLEGNKVYRARTIMHVDIDNGGNITTAQTPSEQAPEPPGIPPEEEKPTQPAPSISGDAQGIFSALQSKGYNTAAACAILANMHVETGGTFNPEVTSGSGYYGLCQWDKNNRAPKLRAAFPDNYNTVAGQIDFILYECQDPYYAKCGPSGLNDPASALSKDSTAAGCTDKVEMACFVFCKWYEGCTVGGQSYSFDNRMNGYQGYADRSSLAHSYYQQFSGGGNGPNEELY